MSEQTSEAVHVWRAVGPNAAELWNQCVNCRADETSVEGRLPCRAATTERASTTGGDEAGGLSDFNDEDGHRWSCLGNDRCDCASDLYDLLAARSVPASGAGEDGLRAGIEVLVDEVIETPWTSDDCTYRPSPEEQAAYMAGANDGVNFAARMIRALLDRHAPGGGETGEGGSR